MLAETFYQRDPIRNNKFCENIGSTERYTSTPYAGTADSRHLKQINTNHKISHDSHVNISVIGWERITAVTILSTMFLKYNLDSELPV